MGQPVHVYVVIIYSNLKVSDNRQNLRYSSATLWLLRQLKILNITKVRLVIVLIHNNHVLKTHVDVIVEDLDVKKNIVNAFNLEFPVHNPVNVTGAKTVKKLEVRYLYRSFKYE